ncbi:hypothetical protein HY639_00170 [Candidatus Woesearchaeota archaeon]|nr:hypothetical protein [Candidatus Woesearchaeota archaeon]
MTLRIVFGRKRLSRLDTRQRYLQLAFNGGLSEATSIIPSLPADDRILIEAGTPFIKREGMAGIGGIRWLWTGELVADLKTLDGALAEVDAANTAGATAATVMGSAPTETLNLFIARCAELGLSSMIDMLGVEEPLKVLMRLRQQPTVVILHKGRDEETTRGKVIQYKHINKIRSKFNVLISAAGGVDLREARSAIFNGANIVVVNIVGSKDKWTGIHAEEDVADMAKQFLETIE